jgi:hypothetical protein
MLVRVTFVLSFSTPIGGGRRHADHLRDDSGDDQPTPFVRTLSASSRARRASTDTPNRFKTSMALPCHRLRVDLGSEHAEVAREHAHRPQQVRLRCERVQPDGGERAARSTSSRFGSTGR